MTRCDFLTLLALGTGATVTGCLGGCKKDNDPGPVDFTLDLNAPANAALGSAGGYVYAGPNGEVIVARTSSGSYVAASRRCTHQDTVLEFRSSSNVYHCSNHGAEFNTSGTVVRQPSTGSATDLKVYTVTQAGSTLRIKG